MSLTAGGPNWLGSPQHVIAGFVLAAVVVGLARHFGLPIWLAVVVAIGVTSTAEILVELVEYPLLYSDKFHYSAYWDTLADLASTLVGGIAGAIVAAFVPLPVSRRGSQTVD